MKIVAFLQCQWFKDAKRAAKTYADHGATPEGRAKLNAIFLFYKSRTGRVIKAALGESLCNRIIWEEASPKLADKSTGAFPPDPDHIRGVLEHFKPDLVLCFGKIAAEGVKPLFAGRLIEMPHPTARGINTVQVIGEAMAEFKNGVEHGIGSKAHGRML